MNIVQSESQEILALFVFKQNHSYEGYQCKDAAGNLYVRESVGDNTPQYRVPTR